MQASTRAGKRDEMLSEIAESVQFEVETQVFRAITDSMNETCFE